VAGRYTHFFGGEMTDQEWLTTLLGALKGADWAVVCAGIERRFPYATAAVQHRITNERRVVHFPLQTLRHPEIMSTEILRQLTT
jgi:hypothetical protein